MARNLVLMLDGTSNEVKEDLTNVLKLYRMCERSEVQRVFYHPGVGTVSLVSDWSPVVQGAVSAFGLATGWGLDANVVAAYCYLVESWRPGDRIFLFGFSRGAYTARAVAGLIHMLGLLEPDQLNLARHALKAYKLADRNDRLEIAWHFRRVIGGRRVPIHFLGVWDTVASVLVRRGLLRLPKQAHLPYTKTNPSVRAFRQAAAIDERRRMFRLYKWTADQVFKPNPFEGPEAPQDQKTVWFAGVHADIGGGYAEAASQAAKFPLIWMAREAQAHGLAIDEPLFAHLAAGAPLPGGKHDYVAPNASAPLHDSLSWVWWPLEVLPKKLKWRRYPEKSERAGYYLPRGELRKIEDGARLHWSVAERFQHGYRPANLPAHHVIEHDTEPCPPASGAGLAAP